MCRVVDTVLVDQETVYAPRHGNDDPLLGLKGSLNEYELGLLRQRSLAADPQDDQQQRTHQPPPWCAQARRGFVGGPAPLSPMRHPEQEWVGDRLWQSLDARACHLAALLSRHRRLQAG